MEDKVFYRNSDFRYVDYFFNHRRIQADKIRALVGSWIDEVGYLELRLPGLVKSVDAHSRYLEMCAYWRQITNGRLRSRRVTFGGYRSVEFIEQFNRGRGDLLVDVYFCVATRTRWEALMLLSEWIAVTKQRYNRILTYASTGDLDETRIDAWDAPRVWREVVDRLKRHQNVLIGVGDQRIGSRRSFEKLFCPESTFVPHTFRYKWVIPFGEFDLKSKVRTFVPPPPPGYELVLLEEKKQRVVRVEMPPTSGELRAVLERCRPELDVSRLRSLVEEFCETPMSDDVFCRSVVEVCESCLREFISKAVRRVGDLVDATNETPDQYLERRHREMLAKKK